jgi:predicted nucleic-acid-binding protein
VIALDANVIVRYLLRDDPKQAKQAKALVDRLDRDDEQAYVSDVVLCEVVWVLRSVYGFGREQIGAVLRQLIAARQLTFDSSDRLLRAVRAFDTGKGDFADYVIREQARDAGCNAVRSFDKALLGEDVFAAP